MPRQTAIEVVSHDKEAGQVFWDYAQKHPLALRELTSLILGERLAPTHATCQRLAQAVPLIALTPIA